MFSHIEEPEKIICAAIHYLNPPVNHIPIISHGQPFNINEGIVLCGYRHNSITNIQLSIFGSSYKPDHTEKIEGFLTSKNNFLTREEAVKLFNTYDKSEYPDELYSEDLY